MNDISYRYFIENYCLINGKKPNLKEYEIKFLEEIESMTSKGCNLKLVYFRRGSKYVWVKDNKRR